MGKYLYGIDLGTTYSCVAYLDENGKAIVCKNADGESTTPSVVQMLPGKPVVVGKEAKGTAVFEPEYTLSFIKNVIGRKDESGEFKKIYYGKGQQISPVDASAEILKVLAKEAGAGIGDTVKDVVITCPAYFNNEQKMATKQAGIRAGLNVLSIIDEPTAAAISYGLERGETGQKFLVYDLGGGTFDITVMEIKANGGFKVICSEGDHDLGGGRWDATLIEYVTNLWREKFDMSLDDQIDAESLTDLKEKIEVAKKNLSERDQYNFNLATDEGTLKVELTRELFDKLTSSLLDISINLTKKAIAQAQGFSKYKDKNGMVREKDITQILADFPSHYDSSKLTKILLVGGSTYMPQVKERVEKEFGLTIVRYEPNEAVAKGAAIYAKIVASQPVLELGIDEDAGSASQLSTNAQQLVLELGAESLVTTITNKSYGTDVMAKYPGVGLTMCVQNLIIRGMELPCTQSDTFYTSCDNQRKISMKIYESDYYESLYLDDPKKLIFDRILNIPKDYPAGTEIRVIMSLNAEGILKLDASVGGHHLNEDFEVKFE